MSADHVHDAETLPPPTLQEVSDGIFAYVQLDGSWCLNNTGFLVGRDGVTAIDTCATEGRTRAFLDALGGVTSAPVRVLVNTHHHGDHTHGNWLLPAAAVVGHELCRHEVLTTGSITKGLWPWVEWGEIEVWPPFVTFDDHLSVWVDDLEVSLQHIGPAHTTNDVVAWVADRSVLFTGDLVFNGGTPFVVMGSVSGSLDSVERLRAFGATTVVPGHGSVCGPEVFDQLTRYFEFVQSVAREGKAAGLSPLDAALQTDLGEFSEWHDRERIVGNLHRAYAELDGAERGAQIDVVAALTDMVAYNGGQPLRCLA